MTASSRTTLICLCTAAVLSGCATRNINLHTDSRPAKDQTAVLRLEAPTSLYLTAVDGRDITKEQDTSSWGSLGNLRVSLTPGGHELKFRHKDAAEGPAASDAGGIIKRTLAAGREYILKSEQTDYDQPDKPEGDTDLLFFRVWIEDSATGEMVGKAESVQLKVPYSRIDRFIATGGGLILAILGIEVVPLVWTV